VYYPGISLFSALGEFFTTVLCSEVRRGKKSPYDHYTRGQKEFKVNRSHLVVLDDGRITDDVSDTKGGGKEEGEAQFKKVGKGRVVRERGGNKAIGM